MGKSNNNPEAWNTYENWHRILAGEMNIYRNAFHSFSLYEAIHKKARSPLTINALEHPILNHYCHLLFKNTVIELAKLFSPDGNKNHFSFRVLLKVLSEKYQGDDGGEIRKNIINQIRSKLRSCKNDGKRLIDMRNKLYAHTDRDEDNVSIIDFDRIPKLLETAHDFISQVLSLEMGGVKFDDYLIDMEIDNTELEFIDSMAESVYLGKIPKK